MVIHEPDLIDVGEPARENAANDVTEPATVASDRPGVLGMPNSAAHLPFADLPYTFAKRHGVLLERGSAGELLLVHRPGIQMNAVAEARRKLSLIHI